MPPEPPPHLGFTGRLPNFGPGIRTDRNLSVLTLSDDTRIEPLMDAGFNNVAMAKPSSGQVALGYEQTDAFGNLINPSGALADLGSFSWRGREGTINFRFKSTSGDPGLYRMGDRPMEAATGRFTQPDRLILADATPLGANRYVYALNDPVNYSDGLGFQSFTTSETLVVAGVGLFFAGQAVEKYGTAIGSPTWVAIGQGAQIVGSVSLVVGLPGLAFPRYNALIYRILKWIACKLPPFRM
jgi:RHS repeat-associated protein